MPLDSTPRLYDLTLPDGHRGRGLAQQVLLPADDPRGSITVVMATETESLDALETRVHWLLAIVGAAIVLVAAVVATIAVERSLGPVRELAVMAERIDPEGPPVELQTEALPTELKPVARKLGSLVRRLFEVLERERRFSRNVAHELRNPLAEMRMLADVGTMATSLDEARRRLQEVGASSTELEQIVESLLALARYESGREQPQPEPVELAGEVRRHLELSEKTAGQRSLSVQRHLPREHWVLADSSLLQRLVANLTSNAIAHAPGGSLVRVEINGDGSLVLENDAPNLKPGDLPRLGERFYRIDTGNGMTHAGLGLSLAQGIADLLGLKLELSLREDQRLVVTLSGFEPLPG
jgi:two-component system sensor histidine kinase QseC